jgi:pantoate--beta-alanine ligase
MQIFNNKEQLKTILSQKRREKVSIGFVPTMGALHEGHLSLLKKAKKETDIVVCSIFVNPKQFNENLDFVNYPKTPVKDIDLLKEVGCNLLYMPEINDIYEHGNEKLDLDLGYLDQVMEGKFRPNHFNGVVTVVDLLFKIVQPDKAYFGKKDFQQLSVIKYMSAKLHPKIEIIGIDTSRDEDGLAKSSRNLLLNESDRKLAVNIYQSLKDAREKWNKGINSNSISEHEINFLNASGFQTEYFEIVDMLTLKPLREKNENSRAIACVAVRLGKIRLIDNIELN